MITPTLYATRFLFDDPSLREALEIHHGPLVYTTSYVDMLVVRLVDRERVADAHHALEVLLSRFSERFLVVLDWDPASARLVERNRQIADRLLARGSPAFITMLISDDSESTIA